MSLHVKSIDPALSSSPVALEESDGISPEIYRQLYVSLNICSDSQPVIGVTSAIAGEGKTTIALGLARTLAQDLGSPVTLSEVDVERPVLAERFGLVGSQGLAEVLRGERQLADVMCLIAPNLCLVTAGSRHSGAASLLQQLSGRDIFHGSYGARGITVLDLPPILNHGYSSLAVHAADTVLLVVRAGVTPVEFVREAVARLEGHPPDGVVFNAPRSSVPSWWPGGGA